MDLDTLRRGHVYTCEFDLHPSFIVNSTSPYHARYEIRPGEVFLVTDFQEVNETASVDIEILFQGRKMWFTFPIQTHIIEDVRRAESYDIPFMALQEEEPGSNSTSLVDTYSPTPPDHGLLLTLFSFSPCSVPW